jgi:cytochrome P450
VEATIAEILRINPVGPVALPHVPLTDTELCGYAVKKVLHVLTILLSDLCGN